MKNCVPQDTSTIGDIKIALKLLPAICRNTNQSNTYTWCTCRRQRLQDTVFSCKLHNWTFYTSTMQSIITFISIYSVQLHACKHSIRNHIQCEFISATAVTGFQYMWQSNQPPEENTSQATSLKKLPPLVVPVLQSNVR